MATDRSAPSDPSAAATAGSSRGPGASPPEGLYVHFPFCISHCPYCDFVVYAGADARGPRNRIDALVGALEQELDLRADLLDAVHGTDRARPPLGSVYLGGGTPSLMPAAQLDHLLGAVAARFGIAAGAEITLEANPGADEIGDLHGFVAAGVTRLSLGAQSMHVDELRRLGRRHEADDVVRAVGLARRAGIGSVGIDLLSDIPGQSIDAFRRSLEAVLALEVDHLSVYALTLDDEGSIASDGADADHLPVPAGARRWRARARAEQSDDRAAEMEHVTDELAGAAGLRRYEIANLARPGHESRHNRLYWRRRPYLAIGPGAHASDGARLRTWNAARLDGYLAALAAGRLPPGGRDEVDEATARAEAVMLGLRMSEGVEATVADDPAFAPALQRARAAALVEIDGGRCRLTAHGRLLADEVFVHLLPEPPGRPTRDATPATHGYDLAPSAATYGPRPAPSAPNT